MHSKYSTVKTCEPPAAVDHSTLSPEKTSYNYGDTITYTCVEGYEKTSGGSLVRTCADTDTWSETAPVCDKKGRINPNARCINHSSRYIKL